MRPLITLSDGIYWVHTQRSSFAFKTAQLAFDYVEHYYPGVPINVNILSDKQAENQKQEPKPQ